VPLKIFRSQARELIFHCPPLGPAMTHGHRFEEHGAWALVLEKASEGWRIKGYGWRVASYREFSP